MVSSNPHIYKRIYAFLSLFEFCFSKETKIMYLIALSLDLCKVFSIQRQNLTWSWAQKVSKEISEYDIHRKTIREFENCMTSVFMYILLSCCLSAYKRSWKSSLRFTRFC